jgi:hypothetical protein
MLNASDQKMLGLNWMQSTAFWHEDIQPAVELLASSRWLPILNNWRHPNDSSLSTGNLLHMIDRKKGTGTHTAMQVGETSPITRPITVHTDASLYQKNGRVDCMPCLGSTVTELPSQPNYSALECWTSWSCAITWSHGIAPCSTPSVAPSHESSDFVSDAGLNISPSHQVC